MPEVVREADRRGVLAVHALYATIQGETSYAGRPCVIVRLAGCPLRCVWCDTRHAYEDGKLCAVEEVLADVALHGYELVAVTGGEPLAQAATRELLRRLADAGRTVLVETSGALPIDGIDRRVRRIVDAKPPSSGEAERNLVENYAQLRPHDEVKIVLATREDYEWARALIRRHALAARCAILLSPIADRLPPADLAEWILADELDVRLQLQLHKLIWSPERCEV